MRIQFFIFFMLLSNFVFAQVRGLKYDPKSSGEGEKPYEMAARVEERIPVATFDDGTKWDCRNQNCDAGLSQPQNKGCSGKNAEN